ncbi:HAMP domain-containing sensor histidine kinase [Bdellovibrionota bacterium FG-1]
MDQDRRIREQFVSTLTHDLRNPLTSAKMAIQLLGRQMDVSPPKALHQARLINQAISSIDRADRMIQDLLDASRLREGESLPIQVVPCVLKTVMTETIEDLSLIYGNRFVLESDGDLAGYWCCDGLKRVIDNLICNAIKYGKSDGKITLRLKDQGARVLISVHNEGEALSSDERERIFEPFYRTHSAQNGGKNGWGLGLTLVRGMVQAHGGTVHVVSQVGDGTTFTLDLPKDCR